MEKLQGCITKAADVKARVGAIKKDLEHLSADEACLVRAALFDAILPGFFISGRNFYHNYKYREDAIESALRHHVWRKPKGPHGHDVVASRPCELKSMKLKVTAITLKTAIGEIDKVHAKLEDEDLKSSDFAFGLFREDSAKPVVCFYISSADFMKFIFPRLEKAAANYREKTNDMKNKARDSFKMCLEDIIHLPSFEAFSPSGNLDERHLAECIRKPLQSLVTCGVHPARLRRVA